MRKTAANLREMDYITDISIDETSFIMFLKYRQKNQDKERYDYQIYQSYDHFDKDSEYNKALKASKTLNRTSLLIRPKFGTIVTQEVLKTELGKFMESNEVLLPQHTPTVNGKNILLQFESQDDTDSTKALFDIYKANFLQGNCNSTIM